MKKAVHSLIAITLFLGMATTSFGQIVMDGDSTDWEGYPILIEAPDNVDGMFPPEVGAVVTDIVDIKTIKATVIGNVLYGYMEFWGGPAWPNNAYEKDREGTMMFSSRGYYHLLLDIDNDATTGWSTDWYEAHYTPVGYLISQGVAYAPIGAEVMQENFFRTRDDFEVANEGKNKYDNNGQWAADYEEYNGQTDNGPDYEIYNYDITDPDSVNMMRFDGLQINNSSDADILTGNPDWIGHAWGYDFIETGVSLDAIKKYYMAKDGRDVFKVDDVIGICGMTETPIDDWGVDMTTRGEISVVVGVSDNQPVMVEKFSLANNYPNPFNPSTKIQYTLPTNEFVSLKVYDIIGREVATLVNQQQSAGVYDVNFNASNLTSGIYFYKIDAGSFVDVKKMMLIK